MTLENFYKSKEWRSFREVIIAERVARDGYVMDEYTGKQILRSFDIILHHKIQLTEDNVNDVSISLNPDNIMVVSHKSHNLIHNKLGYARRQIYLVYGSPLSGKSTYVTEVFEPGDLIVDIDRIWESVSGQSNHQKPPRLNAVVFGLRDRLMEMVRYRVGRWNNAYIVGGFPLCAERERICSNLGAREVFVEATEEECLKRLEVCTDRDKADYERFIHEWFRRYSATV